MKFMTGRLTKRAVSFLDRKAGPENAPGSPSVWDLTLLVALLVVSVLIVSVIYDGGLLTQIAESDVQLRALREQDATMQEQLTEGTAASRLYEIEKSVPHPKLKDRDVQSIGKHVDVSWDHPGQNPGRYVNYEIELTRLDGRDACVEHSGPTCVFLASDSRNETSGILADGDLKSGRYVWRVAAVPSGTSISAESSVNARSLLSDWSSFASFTLYGSQSERISQTNKVRVGLDLGQGSIFAQRSSDGTIRGLEISLIYALVEGCSRLHNDHKLYYSREDCKTYIAAHPPEVNITSRSDKCNPAGFQACVTFVPIDKWGSYPSAIKRKEVDLFLGTVTKAGARERSGLKFTHGYYTFQTQIYGHAQDVAESHGHLLEWLSRDREIGAIRDSTNARVLDDLLDEVPSKKRKHPTNISAREFDSFPSMEAAMDKGELDGVVIDDAFVLRADWVPIPGLKNTKAFRSYLKNFVHGDKEEYAIAVAFDERDQYLYEALQDALEDGLITKNYVRNRVQSNKMD